MTNPLDPAGIAPLAVEARRLANDFKAPAGQPDGVSERLTEIAMFLEQQIDLQSAVLATGFFRTGIDAYNITQREKCDRRRADSIPCTGNGKTVKCADCPKREGLSLTKRVLT